MAIAWTIIASVVVLMILFAMISNALEKSRARKLIGGHVQGQDEVVRSGETYHVVLSDGRRFEDATVVGYTRFNHSIDGFNAVAPGQWAIFDTPSARIYVRPEAVRFYEQKKEPVG